MVKEVQELAKGRYTPTFREQVIDEPGDLRKVAEGDESMLEKIAYRPLQEDMTVWEMEQQIRIEALTLYAAGKYDTRMEMKTIEKFAKFSHATLDEDRNEFRIIPVRDFAPAWDRAEIWAKEIIDSGSLFFQADKDGQVKMFVRSNLSGFQAALALMGIKLRWDTRSQLAQVGLKDGSWVVMNDLRESALKCMVEENFSFPKYEKGALRAVPADFTQVKWKRMKEAHLAVNSVDCFGQWLEKLPVWDGQPRLDTWMLDAGLDFKYGTDTALLEWVSRSVLLVACRRVLEPGMKHDVMPVLLSDEQGVGKSTSLAWLVPETERSRWFSDELRLSDDSKARVEAIQGSVIVEVPEMTGATTADIESLKAFLSRQVDHVRLAYRANAEPMPRLCSIVGTANRTMLPNDPTGNRRFAALWVETGDVARIRDWLDEHRVQLWAEAWRRAKRKEQTYLDGSLAEAQALANQSARSGDTILEEMARDWCARRIAEGLEHVTLSEAAYGVKLATHEKNASNLPMRDVLRLGRALRHAGCRKERRSVDGAQKNVWVLPDDLPPAFEDGEGGLI